MPRVPGSKTQKVYSGAGFCQELISDRACLLKEVNLVNYLVCPRISTKTKTMTYLHDDVSDGTGNNELNF